MAKAFRYSALAILGALLALLVYRAATQSIAHDEALTYQLYLAGPFSILFGFYDPNNHFLASILMRLSTALFGFSELAIRLPTLAAAALYLWLVWRLSLGLFGASLALVLSVVLLGTNPLLQDFLVAARGYGMAVGLFSCGFWSLLEYSTRDKPSRRLLHCGAVALSCAVMANMTLLFPSFLLAVFFLVTCPPRLPAKESRKRPPKRRGEPAPSRFAEASHFIVPILACALIYWLAYPLQQATAATFYRPAASLMASVEDLVRASHAHNDGLGGLNAGPAREAWLMSLSFFLYPLVLAGALAAVARWREGTVTWLMLTWSSGILAGSLLLHVLTHHLFGWPYPADRTGVYLLPLFGLSLVSLAAFLRARSGWPRIGAPACYATCAVLAASHLVQLNWTHFYVWPYDADDRRIIARLETLRSGGEQPVNVGISWQLEPSFNYYRQTRRLAWLPPFDRSGHRGEHDFYVLIPNDRSWVKERNLEILYEGPHSGTVLARPRKGGQQ